MTFRESIVEAARAELGTAFAHQGRAPGLGLDCVGLLVAVGRRLGFTIQDDATYGRRPVPGALIAGLRNALDEIPLEEAGPGDVLACWSDRPGVAQHVAIVTDRGIVHTHAGIGRVVETGGRRWRERACAAFRFREPD